MHDTLDRNVISRINGSDVGTHGNACAALRPTLRRGGGCGDAGWGRLRRPTALHDDRVFSRHHLVDDACAVLVSNNCGLINLVSADYRAHRRFIGSRGYHDIHTSIGDTTLLKEKSYLSSEKSCNTHVSLVKTYKTPTGPLFLRTCCTPAFIEGLKADDGLRAFARLPEREHNLLLSIAQQPENRLTLAYTATGTIVGQATLAPLGDWWQDISNAYEIAIEVSTSWRKLGIAHQLLTFALEFESLEEYLILGLGLSWHWDYSGLGITPIHYRELIARLFATHGFTEYLTSEPNIRMDPANILVARLGSRLAEESIKRFYQRLLQSDTLPGL